MRRRTLLVCALAAVLGIAVGLLAFFVLHAGLVWSLLLVPAVVVAGAVIATVIGVLTRSEPL